MFPALDIRPAPATYAIGELDGTTTTLVGRRLDLTDPFSPLLLKDKELAIMTRAIEGQVRGRPADNGFVVADIKCWMSTERETTIECSGSANRGDDRRLFIMYVWPEAKFFVMAMFFHREAYERAAAEINGILDSIEVTR